MSTIFGAWLRFDFQKAIDIERNKRILGLLGSGGAISLTGQ